LLHCRLGHVCTHLHMCSSSVRCVLLCEPNFVASRVFGQDLEACKTKRNGGLQSWSSSNYVHPSLLFVHTAEALSSSSTSDLSSATESAKDAASDLKSKAKSVLRGSSAVPNNIATLADLNADVRNEASDYRDPAIATPQDKLTGGAMGLAMHLVYAVTKAGFAG